MQKYHQILLLFLFCFIALYSAAIMAITACTQYCILQYYDWPLVIKEQIRIAASSDISINSFTLTKSNDTAYKCL